MARIAVLSSYNYALECCNYGSLFQLIALQKCLKNLGHEPYVIRYKSMITGRFVPNGDGAVAASKSLQHKSRTRHRSFAAFAQRHLAVSRSPYFSRKLLNCLPPRADIYIVGSDKVWADDMPYYLDFVAKNRSKYSYGASFPAGYERFGSSESALIRQFRGLSVREPGGVEMCREAGRGDATHVADPTLLLSRNQYLRLINSGVDSSRKPKQPYLLCYFGNIESLSQIGWESVKAFAKRASLQIIVVPIHGIESIFPEENLQLPCPEQWLRLFNEATCVLTNSFHGTLFATILERPFLSVIPTTKPSKPIQSVLHGMNLQSRIIHETDADLETKMFASIDWQRERVLMQKLVRRSNNYLKAMSA